MNKTLKEIADFLNGELIGRGDIVISGISGIKEAKDGDITFVANSKYLPLLDKTLASAIITSKEISSCPKPIIRTDNPSLAFVKLVSFLVPLKTVHPKGVHPTAVISKNASLGKEVAVGPYAVIEDGAVIGQESIIYPHCYIGNEVKIGKKALIYPNVSVRERTTLGDNVIIHSGTVIGSDGFGYETFEGSHIKIPQVGTVEIGNDVEIGSNVSIDRARFDKTIIGNGVKIDNLVHIAHNVVIGDNSIVVAQVGISGSTRIGRNVTLAGQVGIVGHLEIGDNAIVMAQSGVNKSIPPDTAVWGYPAKPVETARRVNASVQNLPRLIRTINELKKRIQELEKRLEQSNS